MSDSILIIGSLNMDVTVRVENLPRLGETIFSQSYYESCGGKGANQAVAAAALGLDVFMLGKVGKDAYGDKLIANLKQKNIHDDYVLRSDCPSGRAFIQVDKNGNNNIVVVAGCNFALSKQEIDSSQEAFVRSKALILQNEIPFPLVFYSLKKAKEENLLTIYNPAPAQKIDLEFIKYIDYLIMNEVELQEIFSLQTDDFNNPKKIFSQLQKIGLKNLIVTLGHKGSIYVNADAADERSALQHFSAYPVQVVDTTAAGDTFIGAFTQKILQNKDISEAMRFANAAAALTVSRRGAQESIPSLQEVLDFYNSRQS